MFHHDEMTTKNRIPHVDGGDGSSLFLQRAIAARAQFRKKLASTKGDALHDFQSERHIRQIILHLDHIIQCEAVFN